MEKTHRLFLIFLVVVIALFSCDDSTPIDNDEDETPIEKPEDPKDPENSEDPEDSEGSKHPFLIVTKEMYLALREKSSVQPWKSMKIDAINRANSRFDGKGPNDLLEYIGAIALAYILDEPNADAYAKRVSNLIRYEYSKLSIGDHLAWGGVTPPMNSFFVAILALDIVYDSLTEIEISECEDVISSQISKVAINGSWAEARRGTHGIWDIYNGKRTTPDNAYYEMIMKQITPDGVSPVTNTYAWKRIAGGYIAKSGYMDVLEFTGIDKRYYKNERLKKFFRWLFGSSLNCAKEYVIFGDMLPEAEVIDDLLLRRVVNFDHEASEYAAWFLEGKPAAGHILTYILPETALPSPKIPSSKIFHDGGAFLRDKEDNTKGLQLTLYNIKGQDEWHAHNEANGLSLSALGNRLLVNGGRLGAPVRPAYLNNTLTVNGRNHSSRLGDGIVEGFTSDKLDYAAGSAGPALFPFSHIRNAILVHSNVNESGYFIFLDEVSAKNGDKVKNYLHPANETSIETITSKSEYVAEINHFQSTNNVSSKFYFLTPPNEVNIKKVPSSDPAISRAKPYHNRFEAVYDVDKQGDKSLVTIVFPYYTFLKRDVFERLEVDNYNACTLDHGNATDYIFESVSENEAISNGMNINAEFCLTRKLNNRTSFYFVKNGLSFISGNLGFQSNKKITAYVSDTEGTIISEGAIVKFMGEGIERVKFSPEADVITSGKNFIEVQLTNGMYKFK